MPWKKALNVHFISPTQRKKTEPDRPPLFISVQANPPNCEKKLKAWFKGRRFWWERLPQGTKRSMKRGYGVSWFICWALFGHVGTMLGLSRCWAIWRMFMAYLSQLCSRKKHLNNKKLLSRSCWRRLGAMLGLPLGTKWSMKRGYWVSWFICWALVGHVGTMLGLSKLMLSNLEDVHGLP